MEIDQTVTVTVEVHLNPEYTGDGSDIVNRAEVWPEETDQDPIHSNNTTTAGVPGGETARPQADLSIEKVHTLPGDEIIPGETFNVTLTVTNDGPSTANGVVVIDELPAELRAVSATMTDGQTCDIGRPWSPPRTPLRRRLKPQWNTLPAPRISAPDAHAGPTAPTDPTLMYRVATNG